MFVAGLAAVEKMKRENSGIVEKCSVTAGLSLGEYTALVFAGVMSFEDGLKVRPAMKLFLQSFKSSKQVVKVRAESMAEAAKQGKPHGMLSIVGLTDNDIRELCSAVHKEMNEPDLVCQPANYLFPQVLRRIVYTNRVRKMFYCLKGRVLSGHLEALEVAQKMAIAKGALKAQKVAVSGAFHTKLMLPAKEKLMKVSPRSLCRCCVHAGVLFVADL